MLLPLINLKLSTQLINIATGINSYYQSVLLLDGGAVEHVSQLLEVGVEPIEFGVGIEDLLVQPFDLHVQVLLVGLVL